MRTSEQLGIGIDAGGTFTDGAIVNLQTGEVLSKFKTQTTKDDLPGSIRLCLEGLNNDLLPNCVLAALSTTFATNAIVESRGAHAGAILLGYDSYDIAKVQAECKIAVPGSHDIRGRVREPLDESALRAAIRQMVDVEHVEALAISAMGGVLNPAYEITARKITAEECDLPVVCGHELSMELGAIRRATTSYINARLLPIVVDLIHALESELRSAGVQCPIMVVRSDGSLMSMSDALMHPIHTIFSGPAASAIGALYLSNLSDGIVVDIGGTTTDILFAEDGVVKASDAGTKVNGLDVSTPMVLTHTFGFGGDSHIRRDAWGRLSIGPNRVVPVCVLAERYPSVLHKLKLLSRKASSTLCQPAEFFVKGWAAPSVSLSNSERKLWEALEDGPKTGHELADACGLIHASLLPVDRLERWGSILRSGLTPTDLLHGQGKFNRWNAEASRIAIAMYAKDLNIDEEGFYTDVYKVIRSNLSRELLSGTLMSGNGYDIHHKDLAMAVIGHKSGFIKLQAGFSKPVVGIGAPVCAYLPDACREFGFDPVIPEHSEVANAVGAVVGRVAVKTKATISPGADGFAVHTPLAFKRFGTLEKAESYAENQVRKHLMNRIHEEYTGLRFRYDIQTHRRTAVGAEGKVLVESVISGTAVCSPMPSAYKKQE